MSSRPPKTPPLAEIATLFERKRIKRVPIVRDGRVVGVVSRGNLIHALASAAAHGSEPHEVGDRRIRDEL
jgi:CBS domain-containing protein